jgi:hypothetical protein
MGADRKGRSCRGAALGASLVLVALACLRPQPSGEGAPSSAPVTSPTPAPEAPAPATVQEPAEEREEAPANGAADAVGGVGSGAPPPTPESKRKKPAASPRKSSAEELSNSRDAEPAAADLRRRLDRAYAASSPDCPSARDRKKAVCDLATQICSLTERDPNVASVAEYCEEARRRCYDAERRTSQRCPE